MTSVKQIAGAVALSLGLFSASVQADPMPPPYFVTLAEQGGDVVATGSGAIDLTGLTFGFLGMSQPRLSPALGDFVMGPPGFSQSDEYTRLVGPANFGTSSGTATPSTTGGDTIGIFAAEALLVPENYVSNNLLSSTSLYPATTFAELGVTLGRYVWTWGTGSNQSFTLIIGETPGPGLPGPTPVPEPSSAALLGIALAVLWLAGAHSFGICASLFEKGVGS